jgi:hypothetical protein
MERVEEDDARRQSRSGSSERISRRLGDSRMG